MTIPTKIKIGAHTISIVKVKDLAAQGYWCPKDNKIQLDDGLPPNQAQVTLLHEIIHAIDNELEHNQVELLSQAIYQVLVDNKLVFDGK